MLWLGYSKQRTCEFLTLNRISALRSCCLLKLLNHRFADFFFLIIFWKNCKKRQIVITLKPGDLYPVIALSKRPHDKIRALLYGFFVLFFITFFLPSVCVLLGSVSVKFYSVRYCSDLCLSSAMHLSMTCYTLYIHWFYLTTFGVCLLCRAEAVCSVFWWHGIPSRVLAASKDVSFVLWEAYKMSKHSFPSSSVAILREGRCRLRRAFQENLISSVAYSILGDRATQNAGKSVRNVLGNTRCKLYSFWCPRESFCCCGWWSNFRKKCDCCGLGKCY